jgi:hypothetical protein
MKRCCPKRFSLKAIYVLCLGLLISFSSISFGSSCSNFSSPQICDTLSKDSVQLKTIAVPEPSTVLILGLGCLLVIRKKAVVKQ